MIRLELNSSLPTSQYALGTDVRSQIKNRSVRAPSQCWLTRFHLRVHRLFIPDKQVLIQSFLFILIVISSIHPFFLTASPTLRIVGVLEPIAAAFGQRHPGQVHSFLQGHIERLPTTCTHTHSDGQFTVPNPPHVHLY